MDSMDGDVAAEQRSHDSACGELRADRHHVDDDLELESECGSELLKLLPQNPYGARQSATPR